MDDTQLRDFHCGLIYAYGCERAYLAEDIWLYPSADNLMLFLPLSGSPNPTEQLPERGFIFVFIVD